MGRDIDQTFDAVVDATVDDVWQAISTGPGIDSWFMGRNEIHGGRLRTVFADCEITATEPGERFAFTTPVGADGRVIAYDFLIEARESGSTSVRMVATGFLPDDDWDDEYVAMSMGHAMFFRTLTEYLTFFAGATATPVTVNGPVVADWPAAWAALAAELGLADGPPQAGDPVTVRLAGRTAEGVVYFANAHTLGVRTTDALFRFVRGLDGPMIAMHHVFTGDAAESAWTEWMARVFG